MFLAEGIYSIQVFKIIVLFHLKKNSWTQDFCKRIFVVVGHSDLHREPCWKYKREGIGESNYT